jgi:hypothetical protein
MNECIITVHPPERTDAEASRAVFIQAVADFCIIVAQREFNEPGRPEIDMWRPLCA